MAEPNQSVVPVHVRVRQLQDEARSLAKEHTRALMQAMVDLERMSADIAAGGDAYPAGIRQLARVMADEMASKTLTLSAIVSKA